MLRRLVQARIVLPMAAGAEHRLRDADVARLRLCCELSDGFGLHDDALALVLDLVDEMHGLRGELRALMAALSEEEEPVQARIRDRIVRARGR